MAPIIFSQSFLLINADAFLFCLALYPVVHAFHFIHSFCSVIM